MRSSAESCARQVLHAPLQKLTTTTSPRCSEMRTFRPESPRATRSGAGWPSSAYFSAAPDGRATPSSASAAIDACDTTAARTNKREITDGSTRADTGQALPDSTQNDAGDPRIAYLTMSTKRAAL